MLLECAWIGLRYNEWARATYDRIHGGQQTRKKKAAIALSFVVTAEVVGWTCFLVGLVSRFTYKAC